jgi:hypothetical protein
MPDGELLGGLEGEMCLQFRSQLGGSPGVPAAIVMPEQTARKPARFDRVEEEKSFACDAPEFREHRGQVAVVEMVRDTDACCPVDRLVLERDSRGVAQDCRRVGLAAKTSQLSWIRIKPQIRRRMGQKHRETACARSGVEHERSRCPSQRRGQRPVERALSGQDLNDVVDERNCDEGCDRPRRDARRQWLDLMRLLECEVRHPVESWKTTATVAALEAARLVDERATARRALEDCGNLGPDAARIPRVSVGSRLGSGAWAGK